MRSRMMGLTTVCMGTGPLGLLMTGALADRVGPMAAVQIAAAATLVVLALVAIDWVRASPRGG